MESTTSYTFPVQTGGIFYLPWHRHQIVSNHCATAPLYHCTTAPRSVRNTKAGLNRPLNPFCKIHVLKVIRYGKCRSQNQWVECGWKMFSSSTRFDSEPRTTILDYFVNKKNKIVRLFVLVSHQVALVGCHGFERNFVFFFFFFFNI